MVDLDLFESILENDCGYIEEGDVLTEEFFEKMSKYPPSRVEKLFKRMKSTSTMFALNLKFNCKKCGKEVEKVVSKTKVIEMLKKETEFKCGVCIAVEKEIEEKEKRIISLKNKESENIVRAENTKKYIESYLNPSMNWNDGLKNFAKLECLRSDFCCNKDSIKDHIKNMSYKEFLKTPYWKAISEKVRIKSVFRCSLCNSSKNLSVHHRTYSIHGDELHNMNELICICQECHEKHHDIY
ncbi:hypothetical protein [Cetobacterium sp.]|uniref:hypothetical protein n=1 Tax=Cetobacterium sp. TaxID=2071632 RepID=UPI003F3BB052